MGEDSTVLDAFGGVGGNIIQFAKVLKRSVAVEIENAKSLMCLNNCEIYGVEDKVSRIVSDYLKVSPDNLPEEVEKIDAIFMSPPWGGTGYKHLQDGYSFRYMTPPIREIMKTTIKLSKNIMLFLPKNTNIDEIFQEIGVLSQQIHKGRKEFCVEVLEYKFGNRSKAILVCTGKSADITYREIAENFIKKSDISKINRKEMNGFRNLFTEMLERDGPSTYQKYLLSNEKICLKSLWDDLNS